jgi:hypothetical protein
MRANMICIRAQGDGISVITLHKYKSETTNPSLVGAFDLSANQIRRAKHRFLAFGSNYDSASCVDETTCSTFYSSWT